MIYLDNNSTTQIHPEVLDIVQYYLKDHWGNPSSSYPFVAREKEAIENARGSVAELINAEPSEITFTSCATESSNTAFLSAIESDRNKKHIITTAVEHSSILEICKKLQNTGYEVTYLSVDEDGMINLDELKEAISDKTCLVSVMWANNETGVISPIPEISDLCSKHNVLFHCDASQAVGKLPVDVDIYAIDYLSISGHKMYAPKGIGALYTRQGAFLVPLIVGGGQEHGKRGGTYNTPYIVGLGKAADLASGHIQEYNNSILTIRDYFEKEVQVLIPEIYFNGQAMTRLPNTSSIGISGMDSDIILNYLSQHEVYISSGSACTSDTITPSHVIQAMKGYDRANEALRISLSVDSSLNDVQALISAIKEAYDILN